MGALKESLLVDWFSEAEEAQESAVNALIELVEGPMPGRPDPVRDPAIWVHTAFYTYRSGMDDNDPTLPYLARIEHDFIAALGALNFGDQMRQLHQALKAMRAFHRE